MTYADLSPIIRPCHVSTNLLIHDSLLIISHCHLNCHVAPLYESLESPHTLSASSGTIMPRQHKHNPKNTSNHTQTYPSSLPAEFQTHPCPLRPSQVRPIPLPCHPQIRLSSQPLRGLGRGPGADVLHRNISTNLLIYVRTIIISHSQVICHVAPPNESLELVHAISASTGTKMPHQQIHTPD